MTRIRTLALIGAACAAFSLAACQSMSGDGAMSSDMPMAPGETSEVVTVGGAAMYPTKTIVDNAVNSPIHTTLVAAVKQAGLVETLSGPGPFTVFAPTDDAFAKVPAATLQGLMQPAMKPALTKVLTYHVVPGRITAADLASRIAAGGGRASVRTVEGETLTFTMANGGVMIAGMGGSSAMVSQADVMQSNGVIHVIDGVLLPSM